MFKLVKERQAWWPVSWHVAADDSGAAGEVDPVRIELKLRLLSQDDGARIADVGAAVDAFVGDDPDVPLTSSQKMAKVLSEIVIDWRGVGDADGNIAPFNEANFAQLLCLGPVFDAILAAYGSCVRGEGALRTKN